MSSNINKWRIFCNTENTFVYGFLDGTQTCTSCFNNTNHDINSNSISIESTTIQNVTLISTNDNSSIHGNYVNDCYLIDIDSGVDTVTVYSRTYPYIIGILSFYVDIMTDNVNDIFDLIVRPVGNGFIGVLGSNYIIGDTHIDIGNESIYFKNGHFLKITDGSNTDDIEVINVTGNILTLKSGLTHNYTAGSYISFNLKRLRNYITRSIGYRVVGSFLRISTFPIGMEAVILYTNKTANAKKFVCGIEYLC